MPGCAPMQLGPPPPGWSSAHSDSSTAGCRHAFPLEASGCAAQKRRSVRFPWKTEESERTCYFRHLRRHRGEPSLPRPRPAAPPRTQTCATFAPAKIRLRRPFTFVSRTPGSHLNVPVIDVIVQERLPSFVGPAAAALVHPRQTCPRPVISLALPADPPCRLGRTSGERACLATGPARLPACTPMQSGDPAL
jgi:hypothetical protein